MHSFPIYILDLSGEDVVVFPDDRRDLDHTEYWETTVAALVAAHYRVPVRPLKRLPYCQRRARIVLRSGQAIAWYGERQSKRLLRIISRAVGIPSLQWGHDEHEQRLEFHVAEFKGLLAGV